VAGPWLKMECATPDKPEVLAITAAMGWDDPDLTVGKLFRLWRWFDQHTTDGNAESVTAALLDRVVGVSGFVAAVAKVRWLSITDEGISLTNFDKHNGETAKQRANTAKRVAGHKANAKGNAGANDEGNDGSVTGALPRGRGRSKSSSLRSEDSAAALSVSDLVAEGVDKQHAADWLKVRKDKRAPLTRTAWDEVKAEAEKAGISPADAVKTSAVNSWQGFKARWLSDPRASPARPSKHAGFDAKDYTAGVNADGTLA